MADDKSPNLDDRPLPTGPVAGALGLALLGAALLRYLRRRRERS